MARRRHFLIGVTTASTIAIAGCSETDLEDLEGVGGNTSNESADDGAEENQESNNEESEEDEDADEQTGPEAAFEQYRTALNNGDVDTANEIIYTDGDFNELDDSYETPDIETIEYEISEVSPTDYESQTGNDFTEERIELTETGGDDFAIIRWDEEYIRESGEERSFEQYFLLHQIDQEWLIVDFIGSARVESEENKNADEQTGPEASFEQYRTGLLNGDVAAVNEVLYTDGERGELDDSFEAPDIEPIEYEISEVSPTDYESQTGNDFAEERIDLTETGGDDFAIIRWDEEYIGESGEERSVEQYFLLHQINQEWLIVDSIGRARAESEDEGTEEGPQEPIIESINVETSPSVRVTVNVRNLTDESQRRTVWIRVPDEDGNVLAIRSTTTSLGAGTTGQVPFIFDDVAWSGTEIGGANVEARLTEPGAESPF